MIMARQVIQVNYNQNSKINHSWKIKSITLTVRKEIKENSCDEANKIITIR